MQTCVQTRVQASCFFVGPHVYGQGMDVCADMCIDMCTDVRADMCVDMYAGMRTDVCTDMCIGTFFTF